MRTIGIGVLGCGNVSPMYLPVLTAIAEPAGIRVVAVADIDAQRAERTAAEYGVAKATTPDELLADDAVELVLNLTPIAAHVETSKAALTSDKHVYSEKPLATRTDDAVELVRLARARGLALACAPDTLLGTGFQTAAAALADGVIGRPLAATATMLRPELTRPSFYTEGATAVFDMAPYYVSALVNLFGPVRRLSGATRTWPDARPPAPMSAGASIAAAGTLEFHSGVLATLVLSWGTVPVPEVPVFEVFGSEGVLRFPNPNDFDGPAFFRRHGEDAWTEVPGSRQPEHWRRNLRGLGVGELAAALRAGRTPRASGEIACHVVDLIAGLVASAASGRHVEPATTCTPAPLLAEEERLALLGAGPAAE